MKKNLLRRFFATVLLLAISSLTWAYDFVVDGIYYNINSDKTSVTVTYKTTSYNSYSGSVVIPSTVTYNDTEYSVTSIGNEAFRDCSGLTSVTIPNSVTSIGSSAFYGCSGLKKAEFASIESLCKILFSSYSSNPLYYVKHLFINGQEVKDVVIPNSVTSIGEYTFRGCSGLTSVTIPNSVTSIGQYAFQYCSGLTSITIPNSVTSIGNYTFQYCSGLTSVTIGNSVTSIGSSAFYNCSGLTSVTIGNSVTSIGSSAFWNCSGLTSVTIPNSVTSIGSSAFSGCSGLTSVTIPNSVTSIGQYAFQYCRGLTSVTIPSSVTSIGTRAFSSCSAIESIIVDESNPTYDSRNQSDAIIETSSNTLIAGCKNTLIPESVTNIGSYSFEGCTGLESATIPSSVASIGSNAFNSCTSLTSVTLNSNEIVSKTYTSNNNLTTIFGSQVKEYILGEGITSVGDYTFYGSNSLTTVTIPGSVTNIGSNAFNSCTGLTTVRLNSNGIVSNTYTSNNNLTTIFGSQVKEYILGEGITSVGDYAFYGSNGLTSVTIPGSVTSIGVDAFYYTAWYDNQPNGLVYAGKVAYKYKGTMPTGTNISLKEGTLGIGSKAFYGCSGLTSISIPNSVTRIGNHAFSHCSSLSKIYCYAENVPSTESELIFDETPINSAKLFVPKGSVESYKAYSPWKDFGKVLPYNTTIYYIVDGEIYMQYMIEADTPITPEPIPTKEGYTFSGWSAIPETMPADDVIVTGTFSINKYTLTYLLNGEVYLTETVVYGTPLEPEPALRREGYTFTGWSTIPETMPASDVIIKGAFYINGDVNTDNEVDVVDVVDIARFVVGTPAITFMEVLADINKDGTVNIGDAVVLVNDIVGNQNFARIQLDTNRDASNNMLTLTRRNGNLSLNLKNESCYSAFQFDLYVPEGMDVSGIMLNPERKHKHQILYNKIEDGHYRIAALSTVNNIFKGHDGELLNITLDEIPDNEISIRKILFFDSEGQSYQFDDIESMIVTQIENLSSTILKEKEIIYDLQARKRDKLQRGINIVNGKKIVY